MKTSLFFIFFGILLSTGCKKLDKFTQFNIDYTESVTIPANSIVDIPIDIKTPAIETNSESTFKSKDTKADLIESIYLRKMELNLLSPPDGDLSFLNSVSIYISADGLNEVRIAWAENIPDDLGAYLELETTDEDLKAFIKKDTYTLRVKVLTDKVISEDHEINVHSRFLVDAKVLGV